MVDIRQNKNISLFSKLNVKTCVSYQTQNCNLQQKLGARSATGSYSITSIAINSIAIMKKFNISNKVKGKVRKTLNNSLLENEIVSIELGHQFHFIELNGKLWQT